jgi:hypothetical protein
MDTNAIQTNVADYLAVLLLSQQYFTDDLYTQAKIFLRLIVNLWFSVNAESITSHQQVEEARDMLLAHLKECIKSETSALGVVHRLHLEWLNRRISHWATLCYELENSKVMAPEKYAISILCYFPSLIFLLRVEGVIFKLVLIICCLGNMKQNL